MNQTNIDYLFQAITVPPERGSVVASRGGADLPDFGNHLVEASATTFGKSVSGTDHRPTDFRPPGTPEAADTSTFRHENYSDRESHHSDATDVGRSDATNPASQADAEAPSAAPAPETDNCSECDPPGNAPEESKDTNVRDEEQAEDSAENVTVVVAATQPNCTFVAEIAADNGAECVTDATESSATETDRKADSKATQLAVTALPAGDESNSSAKQGKVGLHDSSTAASLGHIDGDDIPSSRGKRKSDRRASGPDDSRSQNALRSTKRVKGSETVNDASEAQASSGGIEQSMETRVAKMSATGVDTDSRELGGDAATKSSASANVKGKSATTDGVLTAVANGTAAALPNKVANGDTGGSAEKISKASGQTRNDAIVDAARTTRGHLSARRGAKATVEADEMSRVDPARFVGRVAKAIQSAHERGGALQLRLSPPELGAVKLALTVKDGVMTASLETETASARRLLLDHLPALRERMAGQNIRIEQFDVDVRRDGTEGRPDSPTSQQQHQQPRNEPPTRRSTAARESASSATNHATIISQSIATSSGINVVA